MRRAWIVVYGTGEHGREPYTLECRRCGGMIVPRLPISVDNFARLSRKFRWSHERCEDTGLKQPEGIRSDVHARFVRLVNLAQERKRQLSQRIGGYPPDWYERQGGMW